MQPLVAHFLIALSLSRGGEPGTKCCASTVALPVLSRGEGSLAKKKIVKKLIKDLHEPNSLIICNNTLILYPGFSSGRVNLFLEGGVEGVCVVFRLQLGLKP